jgi:hypothetical protein
VAAWLAEHDHDPMKALHTLAAAYISAEQEAERLSRLLTGGFARKGPLPAN